MRSHTHAVWVQGRAKVKARVGVMDKVRANVRYLLGTSFPSTLTGYELSIYPYRVRALYLPLLGTSSLSTLTGYELSIYNDVTKVL